MPRRTNQDLPTNHHDSHPQRLLIVFPMVYRVFKELGNSSSSTATNDNAKVQDNSKEFLKVIGNAIPHLGDTEHHLADLSKTPASLSVDPKLSKILGNLLVIILASNLGSKFTPEVHATWEKFLKSLGYL
ncbi:hemoglobin subunit beta-2-like isoform X2 [Ranitomeya imitator]|uniref:hemoglobin subunit beta-2-like isoform X2 n=1 Tax=Ranitomeya imitator TaxID=111125 RepID=UPI0037E7723A